MAKAKEKSKKFVCLDCGHTWTAVSVNNCPKCKANEIVEFQEE